MPQDDIDRILTAIDTLRTDIGDIKVEFAEQFTRLEERQRQQEFALQEHRTSIAALEATKAANSALERMAADYATLKGQVKVIEDEALVERGRRRAWAVILAIGGGVAGAVFKTILSYLPKLL